MREIKFRQAIYSKDKFDHWHYWGLIGNAFIGVDTGLCSPKIAIERSQQYIGIKDKNKNEIYEGDRVEITHWFVPTSDMYPERWLTNSPIVVELPEFYQYILNDEERDIDKENIYEIIPPEVKEKSK